jgi:L-rhamnose mutarotase
MQRMGMVIGLKPPKGRGIQAASCGRVAGNPALISDCNITNYSIFLKRAGKPAVRHWEYAGTDFDADMAKMAAHPKNQEWWSVCMPCQKPLATRKEGEWWAMMEEVFHHD